MILINLPREKQRLNARSPGIVVAVAIVGAMLVSCGGGDDSTNEPVAGGGMGAAASEESSGAGGGGSATPAITTSSLSKDEYIKKASAGCMKVRKDLTAKASAYLNKQSSKGTSEAVLIARLGKELIVPTVEAEMSVIRKLGAPAGDEEEIEAILAADQRAIDEARELQRAKSIEDVLALFAEATKAIKQYGFTACTN